MTTSTTDPPAQATTVLLVEDDAPTSWRLQDALGKAGYQVQAAGTLAEARAALADGAPKVLLDAGSADHCRRFFPTSQTLRAYPRSTR